MKTTQWIALKRRRPIAPALRVSGIRSVNGKWSVGFWKKGDGSFLEWRV